MRRKSLLYVNAIFVLVIVGATGWTHAAEFFEGKTVRIVVGYGAGGGFDASARLVARHMGRHIPGNPAIRVENMPGAGSLIAANYVYGRAEPDGLSLGLFHPGLVTQQALRRDGVKFDAHAFNWIGSIAVGTPTCVIMGFTGIKTLEGVLKSRKQLNFGGTAPGGTTHDLPNLIAALLKAPITVTSGYKGTSDIRVAMERREIDGTCWEWESVRTTARGMLDATGGDQLIPFITTSRERFPADPEIKNVPEFTEVIKGEEDLAIFRAWLNPFNFFRPLVAPRETPKDRVKILQLSLRATLQDPKFLAEAKQSKLDIRHTPPHEIEKMVAEILGLTPKAADELKRLIAW